MSVKLDNLHFSQVKGKMFLTYFMALVFDAMVNIGLIPYLMPPLTLIILFYWVVQVQDRSHLLSAFILGLFTDALLNTTLGAHALLFSFLVFILLSTRHRFKSYPLWHQTGIFMLYFYAYQIIGFFLFTPVLLPPHLLEYWLQPLQFIFWWPLFSFLLNRINYHFTSVPKP